MLTPSACLIAPEAEFSDSANRTEPLTHSHTLACVCMCGGNAHIVNSSKSNLLSFW